MKGILNFKNSITLILLFILSSSFGQISLSGSGWGNLKRKPIVGDSLAIVRIDACRPLRLFTPLTTDTLELNLSADSLKNKNYTFRLEVKYPKSYSNCDVTIHIEMQNGNRFEITTHTIENGLTTYYFNTEQIMLLYQMSASEITFYKREKSINEVTQKIWALDSANSSTNKDAPKFANLYFCIFIHELWDSHL